MFRLWTCSFIRFSMFWFLFIWCIIFTTDARGVKDWSGQVTFGLTADGKETHSQVPIHLNDWHLLGCQHELGRNFRQHGGHIPCPIGVITQEQSCGSSWAPHSISRLPEKPPRGSRYWPTTATWRQGGKNFDKHHSCSSSSAWSSAAHSLGTRPTEAV